jgi:hypothetical protein
LDAYIPPQDSAVALPFFKSNDVIGGVKSKAIEIKSRFMNRWHNYYNGSRKIKKKEGMKGFNKSVSFFKFSL